MYINCIIIRIALLEFENGKMQTPDKETALTPTILKSANDYPVLKLSTQHSSYGKTNLKYKEIFLFIT